MSVWSCSFLFLPFIFQIRILKTKYLENRLSKLRTVFTFVLLASRSSKLDPMLICFDELFFCTTGYVQLQNLCLQLYNMCLYKLCMRSCTTCICLVVQAVSVQPVSVQLYNLRLYNMCLSSCTTCVCTNFVWLVVQPVPVQLYNLCLSSCTICVCLVV